MVDDRTLETLTKAQLVRLAEARGVELPDGQVKKDELVRLLRAAKKRKG